VWLTSVTVAPLLFIVILITAPSLAPNSGQIDLYDQLYRYFGLVVLQLLFSSITWILFWLIVRVITDFCYNVRLHKPLVFITGILLTIGSFKLVFSNVFHVGDEFFFLMLCNCFCIGAGTSFYKLKPLTAGVEI
jgi:hypothetical protein